MSPRALFLSSLLFAFPCFMTSTSVDGQTLFWTDVGTHKIQRLNLEQGSGVQDLITTGVTPIAIALDVANNRMYWTEGSPADYMILSAAMDGTEMRFVIEGLSSPSGIAVDSEGGKLYWTDIGSHKIQRADLDGTGIEDLVTVETQEPVDIALDIVHRKMYWTERSPGEYAVFRSNLDGTNVEGIIAGTGSGASGVAVDPDENKLYWTDRNAGKIRQSNLDGSDPVDLITTGVREPVRIALDLSRGKIYWTEASLADFMISRASLDGGGIELLLDGLISPSGIALGPADGPVVVRPSTWGRVKGVFKT